MATETKKPTIKFVFLSDVGEETRSPSEKTTGMKITRTDTNEILHIVTSVPGVIINAAAYHGIKQSLNDASTSGGKDATIDDRCEALADRFDTLFGEAPAWLGERDGSGPRLGDIWLAISRLKNIPLEQVKESWGMLTEAQQKATREHPTVLAEVAAIRHERATERAVKSDKPAFDYPV